MRVLPEPPPWSQPLPPASPPDGTALYQLPTGTYRTRAALAVKGGSFGDRRDFAATAVLVQHPRGDLLIDAGFGPDVDAHVALLPRFVRAPLTLGRPVGEQLDASGYDRARLLGVVVTHSHWDHVSGLVALDAPVWMNPPELAYAAKDPDGAVYRSVARGLPVRPYDLNGPAYLGYRASLDVHGDGSVVIAQAGGHTDGSVVVFVALPSGRRYAFIGDLTWQLDGIRRRVERPWLLSRLADSDPEQVRRGLSAAIALSGVLQVVPAHDVSAYDDIPRLPDRFPVG